MKPVKGQQEAIELVPQNPLAPGVYFLKTPGRDYAFSINLGEVDTNASDTCVDMYGDGIGVTLGAASYRPCSAAAAEAQSAPSQPNTPKGQSRPVGRPGRTIRLW